MTAARQGESRPRFLRYPRGRVLAVIDGQAEAQAAETELAAAGFEPPRTERFEGPRDAVVFDGTGAQHGVGARLRRTVEFVMMDQAPDVAWYEAALLEGRSVISVRVRGRSEVRRAAELLRARGAHFINHFGLLAT